jgi:hypothetical protein
MCIKCPICTETQLEMCLEILGHPLSNAKRGGDILENDQMIL